MNINIENKIPNAKIIVNNSPNGDINISFTEKEKTILHDNPEGSIVKIDNYDFIVLCHSVFNDNTIVLSKNPVTNMNFGENSNYLKSDVRDFLNKDFYDELKNIIGVNNIIQNIINLIANDGTGREINCKDYVSLITADYYRWYRNFIPNMKNNWWTSTRCTYQKATPLEKLVCYISYNGIVNQTQSDAWEYVPYEEFYIKEQPLSVHPFCVLKSTIEVS